MTIDQPTVTVAEIPLYSAYVDANGNLQIKIDALDTAQPQPGDTLTVQCDPATGALSLSHDHLANPATPQQYGLKNLLG